MRLQPHNDASLSRDGLAPDHLQILREQPGPHVDQRDPDHGDALMEEPRRPRGLGEKPQVQRLEVDFLPIAALVITKYTVDGDLPILLRFLPQLLYLREDQSSEEVLLRRCFRKCPDCVCIGNCCRHLPDVARHSLLHEIPMLPDNSSFDQGFRQVLVFPKCPVSSGMRQAGSIDTCGKVSGVLHAVLPAKVYLLQECNKARILAHLEETGSDRQRDGEFENACHEGLGLLRAVREAQKRQLRQDTRGLQIREGEAKALQRFCHRFLQRFDGFLTLLPLLASLVKLPAMSSETGQHSVDREGTEEKRI
mmetsp:Transcript_115522/g.274585  ORF Transcript_115522/g.274585 Transcript_115522/m.274585 type:complete len:308 (-) Transcript_115522:297-1220(-)